MNDYYGRAESVVRHYDGTVISPEMIDLGKLQQGFGRAEVEWGSRVVVDVLQKGNEWDVFGEDDLMESDKLERRYNGLTWDKSDEEKKRMEARLHLRFMLNDGWIICLPNDELNRERDKVDSSGLLITPCGLYPDDRYVVTKAFVLRCAKIVGLIGFEREGHDPSSYVRAKKPVGLWGRIKSVFSS